MANGLLLEPPSGGTEPPLMPSGDLPQFMDSMLQQFGARLEDLGNAQHLLVGFALPKDGAKIVVFEEFDQRLGVDPLVVAMGMTSLGRKLHGLIPLAGQSAN